MSYIQHPPRSFSMSRVHLSSNFWIIHHHILHNLYLHTASEWCGSTLSNISTWWVAASSCKLFTSLEMDSNSFRIDVIVSVQTMRECNQHCIAVGCHRKKYSKGKRMKINCNLKEDEQCRNERLRAMWTTFSACVRWTLDRKWYYVL